MTRHIAKQSTDCVVATVTHFEKERERERDSSSVSEYRYFFACADGTDLLDCA